jgi:DNA-binding NarL/FixJ family response regulator
MGKRVLVVDDEPDIVDLLGIWLDDDPRCGAVDRAASLADAVSCARASCPDAILLDFWVGAHSSATVLPMLRGLCPRARIVIHTGSYDEALRAHVVALGADGVVEKATISVADVVEALLV